MAIQAQILIVVMELRRAYRLTYLFIAHDLAAVRHRIVEIADSPARCARPMHLYTQGLMASLPVSDPKRERSRARPPTLGVSLGPLHPPSGCRVHPRCPIAIDRRAREAVPLLPVHEAPLTGFVACRRVDVAHALSVSA